MLKTYPKLSFALGLAVQRYASAEESLGFSKENGLSHFYIDAAYPEDSVENWSVERRGALIQEIANSGIRPILHGNFKNPVSHELKCIRQASIDYLIQEVDLAKDLGAPLIVHASCVMLHRRIKEGRARALADFGDSLEIVSAYASARNVPVWVENLENYKQRHPFYTMFSLIEDYQYILDRNSYVNLMFDVGHHYIGGGDIWNVFMQFRDRIAGMNFHDNDGEVDGHRPLGDGAIDFSELIKAIAKSSWHGLVVLETRGGDILDGFGYLASCERAAADGVLVSDTAAMSPG